MRGRPTREIFRERGRTCNGFDARPQGAHRGDSCALVRVCGLKQCVPFAGYFGSSHAALFMFTMHMLLAGKVEAGAEAIKRRNDALSVLRTLVPARCGEPSPCAELDRGPDKVRIKGPMNKAKPRAPPPSCVLRVPLRRAIRQAGPRPSRRHAAHAAHAAARSCGPPAPPQPEWAAEWEGWGPRAVLRRSGSALRSAQALLPPPARWGRRAPRQHP